MTFKDEVKEMTEELKEYIQNSIIVCPTCKGTGGGKKIRGCLFPCRTCGGQGYFLKDEEAW